MKNRIYIFLSIIIIGLFLIFLKRGYDFRNRIKNNPAFTCGLIIMGSDTKGGGLLQYEYYVEGRKYHNSYACSNSTLKKYRSGKVRIWIIYEKSQPQNSFVIERKNDFYKQSFETKDTLGLNCD